MRGMDMAAGNLKLYGEGASWLGMSPGGTLRKRTMVDGLLPAGRARSTYPGHDEAAHHPNPLPCWSGLTGHVLNQQPIGLDDHFDHPE